MPETPSLKILSKPGDDRPAPEVTHSAGPSLESTPASLKILAKPTLATTARATLSDAKLLQPSTTSNDIARNVLGYLTGGGPLNYFNDHVDPRTTLGAGYQHAYNSLQLGFGDERAAASDTLADFLTGNIKDTGGSTWENILTQYRANRDLRRNALDVGSNEHPIASTVGTIAGVLPQIPLFGGAMSGPALIGTSGVLGATQALGASNADLTKGDIVGAMGDTAEGGLIGGLFGAAGAGVRSVAKALSPSQPTATSIMAKLAGGGDPTRAPEKLFSTVPRSGLPTAAEGTELALNKYGLLESRLQSGTGVPMLTNPGSKSNINIKLDYKQLQQDTSKVISKLAEEKDAILNKIQELTPEKYSIEQVVGKRDAGTLPIAKYMQGVVDDFKDLDGYGKEALSAKELTRFLQENPTLTIKDVSKINSMLGDMVGSGFDKSVPEFSRLGQLKNLYFRTRSFIATEVGKHSQDDAIKLMHLNSDLHSLSKFSNVVDMGLTKFTKATAIAQEQPVFDLSKVLDKIGMNNNTTALGFLNSAMKGLGQPAISFAGRRLSNIFNPVSSGKLPGVFMSYNQQNNQVSVQRDKDLAEYFIKTNKLANESEKQEALDKLYSSGKVDKKWVPSMMRPISENVTAPGMVDVFPSWDGRKLKDPIDIKLAASYIDQNHSLTSRDKYVHKQQLHKTGKFDISNVPAGVIMNALNPGKSESALVDDLEI